MRTRISPSADCFYPISSRCKRVLKAAKLAYGNKTKESTTFQKLGCWDFWRISNNVLNKDKSVIHPLFNNKEMLPFASDKAKLLTKNLSRNSNLDDSGIYLSVFSSRTIFKLHNIPVTPKLVKKIRTKLDLPKASAPDLFQCFCWASFIEHLITLSEKSY